MAYEYKTVGGPERGRRERGARRVADRVAAAMQEIIDTETAEGWEYMRTDLVAVEEKRGFLSRRQTMHCPVLVFRRTLPGVEQARAASGPSLSVPRPSSAAAGAHGPARHEGEEGPLLLGVAMGERVAAPPADAAPAPAATPAPAPSRSTGTGRTLYLRRDGRHSTDG